MPEHVEHLLARSAALRVALAAGALVAGCASPAPRPRTETYQTVAKGPHHDADLAGRENARAAALLDKADDPAALASAESALKAALEADASCGPAHNNLGKVYYRQGDLHNAAQEFQIAMELMPRQPEPPNNLGLVQEKVANLSEAAGNLNEAKARLNQAADAYGKAAALEPDNVQVLGNLARAEVRRGDHNAGVRALLNKLILRDTRPDWLAWEKRSLARLAQVEPPGAEGAGTTKPD